MADKKKRSNLKPGGRKPYKPYKRHYNSQGVLKNGHSPEEVEEVIEHRVLMPSDSSRLPPRIDERDAFGHVTIYDADGHVVRVIAREQLMRPWQERQGNTWNNCLFPKRP